MTTRLVARSRFGLGRDPHRASLALLPVALALAAGGAGWFLAAESSFAPAAILAGLTVALVLITAHAVAVEPAATGIQLGAAGTRALRRELDRARRHRRSFAIVRLPLGDQPRIEPDPGGDGIAAATLRLLGTTLRITDSAWVHDGDVVVLLPESDRATAEAFLDRARAAAPERFNARAGIALFPDDAMTSGGLLEAAERDMLGHDIPRPIVPSTVAAGDETGTAEHGLGSGIG